MSDQMTSQCGLGEPIPTAKDILAAIEAAATERRCIGDMFGMPVFVDRSLGQNTVEIRGPRQTIRFSVDHPLIQGTRLERAARW